MKKYVIKEYKIDKYEDIKQSYILLLKVKELNDVDLFNTQCRNAMNTARIRLNTENVLCFAEYSKDDIVILEFDYKADNSFIQWTKRDDKGLYIEVDES